MASLFGPMRGTYQGPYPTREQAFAALDGSGVRLNLEDLKAGRTPYPPPEPEDVNRLLEDAEIRAALYRDATVILGSRKYVFLIDRSTGTVYARYVYRNRGREYLHSRLAAEAIAEFSRGIEIDPDEPSYFEGRAEAHLKNGDRAAALADYERALKARRAAGWWRRGLVEVAIQRLR